MKRTLLRIALCAFFAAFSPSFALSQAPNSPVPSNRDPFAFRGEEDFILESPEDHVAEERAKAAQFALERLFRSRGVSDSMSDARFDGVKKLVESLLADPRHVATDEEKKAFGDAFTLSQPELDATIASFNAAFLAKLGYETQRRLGIKNSLPKLSLARQILARYARSPRSVAQEAEAPQAVAKLDQLLADVPYMEDAETYLLPKTRPGLGVSNYTEYALESTFTRMITPERRITLPESCDFIAFLKRSIELEENGDALVALAAEYQARGNYDKALELWNRAKTAKAYSLVEQAKTLFGVFEFNGREQVFLDELGGLESDANLGEKEARLRELVAARIDRVVAELEKTPSIQLVTEGSESKGMRVTLSAFSRHVRALKTTFYHVDLTPFIAGAHDRSFTHAPFNGDLFVNLVAEGLQDLFRNGTPISSFATEVQSSVADVAVVEGREYAPVRTSMTFDLEKPGAYLVKVVDANDEDSDKNVAYALAFANRYAFAYQYKRLVITDFQTGKPYANGAVDLILVDRTVRGGDESTTVTTDASGYVKPKSHYDHVERLLAFVHDGDEDGADRSVSFFDSRQNVYMPQFANDEIIRTKPLPLRSLVLATDKPVYAPGETVEFVGQTTRYSGYSFPPGTPQGVRVYQKQRPLPEDPRLSPPMVIERARRREPPREIASFEVTVDETGGFAGSFKIPDDAEPGEYFFAQGHIRKSPDGKTSVADEYKTTLYISTRADAGEPTAAGTPTTPPQPIDAPLSSAPIVELEFETPSYSAKAADVANVVVHSSIPDANVVIEKNDYRAVGQQDGYVAPDAYEVKSVELRDGVGSFSCSLANSDAPYFILTANASRDSEAQTYYYLVGARKSQFFRNATLDAPERVKPGEKVRLTAKFAPLEDGDALFGGRATLVLYDVERDLVPGDDFSSFLKEAQPESRLLLRQDYASLKVMRPTVPPKRRSERKSIADREPQRPSSFCYEHYVDAALPLPWDVPVEFGAVSRRDQKRRSRSEFVLEEVPKIPASASPDSVLQTTTTEKRADSVSFDFDAPKTPGTYIVFFRAFDKEKECATFVTRYLDVE